MPPPDPIRERLLNAVRTRLQQISADGTTFWFTPGRVLRDWVNFDEAQAAKGAPVYCVIEGSETQQRGTLAAITCKLTVYIVGWVVDDENRRTALNQALADIVRAIDTDWRWGDLAITTRISKIDTDEAAVVAKPFAYFELSAEIEYSRAKGEV